MGILTKKIIKELEKQEYAVDVLPILDKFQAEHNYSDEQMNSDLEVVLWKSFGYININKYEFFELTEKVLSNVKEEGINNSEWCYRYACAIVYLRRFEEALEYCKKSVKIDPDFAWAWLELTKLYYKFNLLDEAYKTIEKGLQLKPNDYTFLTLKDDIDNNRGFAFCLTHYIDEEADKDENKEELLNIDDEKLYNEFLNRSEIEKEIIILDELEKFQEIIDLINSLPKEKLTSSIIYSLSKAYNNNSEPEKAIETLLIIEDKEKNTALWNHRMAYSYLGTDIWNPNAPLNTEGLEKAEKYIVRALEIEPERKTSIMMYRLICSKIGNSKVESEESEAGLKYLLKARELATDEETIILTERDLGWAYDHIKEYEKAYNHLQNVVALGVDNIWIHSELGFCFGGLEKYQEAIKHFEKAIEMGRNDDWIYARLGTMYEKLENYDKALEIFFKGLKAEEKSSEIWLLSEIAWIYNNKKSDFSKGLEYLEKAKKLGRDDIWINSEFGLTYNYYLKDYPKGLKYLLNAKEFGRDDEWLNTEIGFSLKNLERYEEALEFYKNSEKLGRNDEWLNLEMAECLEKLEKIGKAIIKLKEALAFEDCDELFIKGELGRLYGQEEENFNEALKYLYEAEKIKNDDVWICSEIAWNLLNISDDIENLEEKTANLQKGLEYLNKAKKLGRDDKWINGQLGFVLTKLGNNKESIKYFEKARFIDSEDEWIAYNLGVVYKKVGEIQKAIDILNIVLESGEYKGWTELELAWCYALIDEKEKAREYLKEADSYIGGEIANSSELKKDFETVKQLLSATSYLS